MFEIGSWRLENGSSTDVQGWVIIAMQTVELRIEQRDGDAIAHTDSQTHNSTAL
jgi:hypothetical protein